MVKFWKQLAYTSKFSIIAFVVSATLGLLSMGVLGGLLYYAVSFLFNSYPSLNDWTGDWVWPTVITVGMLWSLGFLFAGYIWHALRESIKSLLALRIIYILTLWLWAAILWFVMISKHL